MRTPKDMNHPEEGEIEFDTPHSNTCWYRIKTERDGRVNIRQTVEMSYNLIETSEELDGVTLSRGGQQISEHYRGKIHETLKAQRQIVASDTSLPCIEEKVEIKLTRTRL